MYAVNNKISEYTPTVKLNVAIAQAIAESAISNEVIFFIFHSNLQDKKAILSHKKVLFY
jgi:acyl-CoA reductase-like NAD-dependent aldehyde dehydrogenase